MPRSVEEIRAEQTESATLRNLSAVLDAKLTLASRLGLYEFEAGEEGLADCSEAFRMLGRSERRQIRVAGGRLLARSGRPILSPAGCRC